MVYIEVVEDWFGNPVSLLITNCPEERDGVCVCLREREFTRVIDKTSVQIA